MPPTRGNAPNLQLRAAPDAQPRHPVVNFFLNTWRGNALGFIGLVLTILGLIWAFYTGVLGLRYGAQQTCATLYAIGKYSAYCNRTLDAGVTPAPMARRHLTDVLSRFHHKHYGEFSHADMSCNTSLYEFDADDGSFASLVIEIGHHADLPIAFFGVTVAAVVVAFTYTRPRMRPFAPAISLARMPPLFGIVSMGSILLNAPALYCGFKSAKGKGNQSSAIASVLYEEDSDEEQELDRMPTLDDTAVVCGGEAELDIPMSTFDDISPSYADGAELFFPDLSMEDLDELFADEDADDFETRKKHDGRGNGVDSDSDSEELPKVLDISTEATLPPVKTAQSDVSPGTVTPPAAEVIRQLRRVDGLESLEPLQVLTTSSGLPQPAKLSTRGWWVCCQCRETYNPAVISDFCPSCVQHLRCSYCYVLRR